MYTSYYNQIIDTYLNNKSIHSIQSFEFSSVNTIAIQIKNIERMTLNKTFKCFAKK